MSSPLHLSSEATTKSKKRENCFFRVSANYPHIQVDSENTSRLYKWLPVLFFFCPEHYGTGSPLSVSHSLWYSPRDVQYRWFSEEKKTKKKNPGITDTDTILRQKHSAVLRVNTQSEVETDVNHFPTVGDHDKHRQELLTLSVPGQYLPVPKHLVIEVCLAPQLQLSSLHNDAAWPYSDRRKDK